MKGGRTLCFTGEGKEEGTGFLVYDAQVFNSPVDSVKERKIFMFCIKKVYTVNPQYNGLIGGDLVSYY